MRSEGAPGRGSLLWPVLAVLALHLALMARYIAKFEGDLSALLCVGAQRADLPPYECVTTHIGTSGYDGQFYFVLAQDPWRKHEVGIDAPAARHLRVLYPAVCWLGSGGSPGLLLWIMPAVNLAAIAGLAWLGARYAVRYGLSPWWGVTLPLALDPGLPALHNLTDPLAMLALFALLDCWLTRAPWWAVALTASAALLAREQNLAIALIILGVALWQRRTGTALAVLAAVALWVGWVVLLRLVYGGWPFLQASGNFATPLTGLAFRWTHLGGNDGFSRRLAIIFAACLVHLTLLVGLALALTRRAQDPVLVLSMYAGVALVLCAGTYIYRDFWAITRVFVWLPMGVWMLSAVRRLTGLLLLSAAAVLWPLCGALGYV